MKKEHENLTSTELAFLTWKSGKDKEEDIEHANQKFKNRNVEPKNKAKSTQIPLEEQIEYINEYHRSRKRNKSIYMDEETLVIE